MKLKLFFVLLVILLSGCSNLVPKTEVKTSYWIYDIKTNMTATEVSSIIIEAIQSQVSEMNISRNIPPHPLPSKPNRFQMRNIMNQSDLGAIMSSNGMSMQIPVCDGAIVTGIAVNTGMNQWGENTSSNVCLWQYQGGFSLDLIVKFTNTSGGFSAKSLGKTIASSFVGDSGNLISDKIDSIYKKLNEAGLKPVLVQKYP